MTDGKIFIRNLALPYLSRLYSYPGAYARGRGGGPGGRQGRNNFFRLQGGEAPRIFVIFRGKNPKGGGRPPEAIFFLRTPLFLPLIARLSLIGCNYVVRIFFCSLYIFWVGNFH